MTGLVMRHFKMAAAWAAAVSHAVLLAGLAARPVFPIFSTRFSANLWAGVPVDDALGRVVVRT